jgi:hypothetical protein
MRLVFAPLCLLVACGKADTTVTYEKDIAPLVEGHCQGCHVPTGIGPFPLTSYDEVVAMQGPARADIEARKMPPFLAGKGCTEYQNDISLSDDEIALFGKWIDQGSQRGTLSGTSQQSVSTPASDALPRVDATLSVPGIYTPKNSPDDYRCFVLDWNQATDKYVTGFRVVPGNPKIVHHVIAYLALPSQVAAVQQLDDADPGPGYTCFGGSGAHLRTWLGAWAPGGVGGMYPDNTGIQVQTGSKVVLQVHYNMQSAPMDATDQTQVEVALSDTVLRPAVLAPWTNPDWTKTNGMVIPAFQSDVEYDFAYDPTPFTNLLSNNQLVAGEGLRMYSVSAHQHLLGKSSRLEILRTGDPAQAECLLDIPRWDFHWQRAYRFAQGKILHPGDQLKITCRWDNSAAAQPIINGVQQTPRDVQWGEGTSDEMCLSLIYVTN